MNLRLRQKMILSQNRFVELIEFAARTETESLLDFFCRNEIAPKTEKEILLETFLKIGMNLQLREKMILF